MCRCAVIRCTKNCGQPLLSPSLVFKVRGVEALDPLFLSLSRQSLHSNTRLCIERAIVIIKILIRRVTSYILKSSVA